MQGGISTTVGQEAQYYAGQTIFLFPICRIFINYLNFRKKLCTFGIKEYSAGLK